LVEGGSDDNATMGRTAFQVEYRDGFVMVDAGMDRAVHHFFEKNGPQPFDDSAANKVALAVQAAKLIVVTHEHGDHIAGTIRNANKHHPTKNYSHA
jgi:glyoxylase-like metal-dependent hydrolase (beta-lactamase superfamily II)